MRISDISPQSQRDKSRLGRCLIRPSRSRAPVALIFLLTLTVFIFESALAQADDIGLRPVSSSLQIIAPPPAPTIRLYYDLEPVVAQGEIVYGTYCAGCHGTKLEGQPNWHVRDAMGYLPAPPHDETGHTWHHRDQLLFDLTKYGPKHLTGNDYKTRMPAFENILSDDDIIAVLSYIKSTWPDEVIQIHNSQINQD